MKKRTAAALVILLLLIMINIAGSIENNEDVVTLLISSENISARVNYYLEPITVCIYDEDGNIDRSRDGDTITLSVGKGDGDVHGTLTKEVVDGRVVFDDIMYDHEGDLVLEAVHENTGRTATHKSMTVGAGRAVMHFPEPTRDIHVQIIPQGNSFRVESEEFGTLREPTAIPFIENTECDWDWDVTPQSNGYDLVVTITNPTGELKKIPNIVNDGITQGRIIQYLDNNRGSKWATVDSTTQGRHYWGHHCDYPSSGYAPVLIVKDEYYSRGTSMIYDVMNYKHNMVPYISRSVHGSSSYYWKEQYQIEDGYLEPSETHTYTFKTRFTYPEDFIHTIKPYKQYFEDKFGRVQYEQDLNPILFVKSSDQGWVGESNPRGLNPRVDLYGFEGKLNSMINTFEATDFQRCMVWTVDGQYKDNVGGNMPTNFASEWTANMRITEQEFQRVRDSGRKLYFWWGRSGQFVDHWDAKPQDFDVQNETMRRAKFQEFELALSQGAVGVGLDAVTHVPAWDLPEWLYLMRERYPEIFMTTEIDYCDFLNVICPTITQSQYFSIPHYVSHYICPGREYQALFRQDKSILNIDTAEEFISWGMTIVVGSIFSQEDVQDALDAAVTGNRISFGDSCTEDENLETLTDEGKNIKHQEQKSNRIDAFFEKIFHPFQTTIAQFVERI